MCNHFKTYIPAGEITLSPREAALGLTACALGAVACTMTGVVIGMLISPRKSMTLFSHNGSNNNTDNIHNDGSNDPAQAPEEEA